MPIVCRYLRDHARQRRALRALYRSVCGVACLLSELECKLSFSAIAEKKNASNSAGKKVERQKHLRRLDTFGGTNPLLVERRSRSDRNWPKANNGLLGLGLLCTQLRASALTLRVD